MKKILLSFFLLIQLSGHAQVNSRLSALAMSSIQNSNFYLNAASYKYNLLKANAEVVLYIDEEKKEYRYPFYRLDSANTGTIIIFEMGDEIYVMAIDHEWKSDTSEMVVLLGKYSSDKTIGITWLANNYIKKETSAIPNYFELKFNNEIHINVSEKEIYSFTLPDYPNPFYLSKKK